MGLPTLLCLSMVAQGGPSINFSSFLHWKGTSPPLSKFCSNPCKQPSFGHLWILACMHWRPNPPQQYWWEKKPNQNSGICAGHSQVTNNSTAKKKGAAPGGHFPLTLNVSPSALGRGKFGDQEYCPFRGREGKKGHVFISQTWGNYRRERGTQILGMEGRKVVWEGGKEEGRKKVGRKEEKPLWSESQWQKCCRKNYPLPAWLDLSQYFFQLFCH